MSSSSDLDKLDDVKREIDYQIEQYRHHRTEASRILRILIAFLGILGAMISGVGRLFSSPPQLPQISPQQANQAGEQLNQNIPEVVPLIPGFLGEVIVQWAIIFAIGWLAVGLFLTGIWVPKTLYSALRIREIRRVPPGSSQLTELNYRGLLQSNHRELIELEDSMGQLYSSIRTTVWGLAFALASVVAIAWEELTGPSLLVAFVLLFVFVSTEVDFEKSRSDKRPWLHKFDFLLVLAAVAAYLTSLRAGLLNVFTISGLVLLALLAFVGFYIVQPNESDNFSWIIRKSTVQAVVFGIIGFQIILINPQASNWLASLVVGLFSYAVAVGYFVPLVILCAAIDLLLDGALYEGIERGKASLQSWI